MYLNFQEAQMKRTMFIQLVVQPALLKLNPSSISRMKGAGVDGLEDWELYPEDYATFSRHADKFFTESGMTGKFLWVNFNVF